MEKIKVSKVWKSEDEAWDTVMRNMIKWQYENDTSCIMKAKQAKMELMAYIEKTVTEYYSKKRKDWEENNPYIDNKIKSQTFENFNVTDNNKDIYNKIISKINQSMILYGESGTGKTHMSNALCINMWRDCLAKNKLGDELWIKKMAFDMKQDHLAGKSFEYIGRDMESIDYYKTIPLLIIDEFGRAEFGEEMYNFLFSIINHRIENDLQTIIITNLNITEYLANDLEDGLKSRLRNYFALLNFK